MPNVRHRHRHFVRRSRCHPIRCWARADGNGQHQMERAGREEASENARAKELHETDLDTR